VLFLSSEISERNFISFREYNIYEEFYNNTKRECSEPGYVFEYYRTESRKSSGTIEIDSEYSR